MVVAEVCNREGISVNKLRPRHPQAQELPAGGQLWAGLATTQKGCASTPAAEGFLVIMMRSV